MAIAFRTSKSTKASAIALMVIALGASTTAIAAASPSAHRSGVRGTTTGANTSRGAGRAEFAATPAHQYASGALRTVQRIVLHGGYTTADAGMRNLGYGTLKIKGVPAGAKVKSAILVWDILGKHLGAAFPHGKFDGHAITGKTWAHGKDPCWGVARNFSFEANVTSLVSGNGSYHLTGFASGKTNGADPWLTSPQVPPLLEGATLVVVYQKSSMPKIVIQLAEGASESQLGHTLHAKLFGFTANSHHAAKTSYIVADGQVKGNKGGFDGRILPHVGFSGKAPQAVRRYSRGDLWDTVTVNVSSLVRRGATSATVSVDAPSASHDCIVWVGQVLSVS